MELDARVRRLERENEDLREAARGSAYMSAPASATIGTMRYGTLNSAGAHPTNLQVNTSTFTLHVDQAETGSGSSAKSTGGPAILAQNRGRDSLEPASGLAGDLFVDSAKRLWFCKGGTTWKLRV